MISGCDNWESADLIPERSLPSTRKKQRNIDKPIASTPQVFRANFDIRIEPSATVADLFLIKNRNWWLQIFSHDSRPLPDG